MRTTDPATWRPSGTRTVRFDGSGLDREVWLPHYLPAWSSREATEATHEVRDSRLRLWIPPEQDRWCHPDHTPALRVSALQSGNHSGPVGSTIGQQPYRPGLVVRERQEPFAGWIVGPGQLEARMRMTLSPRSMASLWLIGVEDRPQRSAEICVVEVFGHGVVPGESAQLGTGLHAFRDPGVEEDFATTPWQLDVSGPHIYAARWSEREAVFLVDGEAVRSCSRPPAYPMQIMLAVFDFPETARPGDDVVPELVVEEVSWRPWPG